MILVYVSCTSVPCKPAGACGAGDKGMQKSMTRHTGPLPQTGAGGGRTPPPMVRHALGMP